MRTPSFDIVMIADWRRAGPVFWYQRNLAEAAIDAGYRLATVQVDGEDGEHRAGFAPWLRERIGDQRIVWLDPSSDAEAALSITVDSALLERDLNRPLRLGAELNVVIRTQHFSEGDGERPACDLIDRLDMQLRGPVQLAAATDLIADEFSRLNNSTLRDDLVWRPAVDVDALVRTDREHGETQALIVGTCVESPEHLDSRLFGWRHRALRLRGPKAALLDGRRSWPASWRIDEASATPLLEFCKGLDAYLEGFRPGGGGDALCAGAILTAAAGGLVLAPPTLEPYLGGIAVLSDAPSASIDALAADQVACARARERAFQALRERHDRRCHRQRLVDLMGTPRPPSISLGAAAMPRRRALFFSTNGVGMGHLTRQLAIARRLPASVEPVFLSMSQACGQVERFGFSAEYTPYHTSYGGHVEHWNAHLANLLHEMIAFYDPAALMFDGNYPFGALLGITKRHPGRAFVWCRRGLWQPGQNARALRRASIFDLIIEPLDLATVFDRGPTKHEQDSVRCIPPIRLLGADELEDRETAAAALGLDPARPAALLLLGSRNNFDLAPLVERLMPALRAVDGLQIAAMQWLISERDHGWPEDVHVLSGYPMARHFRAFDFSIATPGYNSFHELVAHRMPTVFIPNENPSMDDHVARATFAERQGFGLSLRRAEIYKVAAVIEAIGRPEIRAKMRDAAKRHATPNGAGLAAEAIAERVHAAKAMDATPGADVHRRTFSA